MKGTIKIHEEKSIKDSGHEKEIAEYGRTKILRDGMGRDEKDKAGRKEREQQNNLNIENVYGSGLKTALALYYRLRRSSI